MKKLLLIICCILFCVPMLAFSGCEDGNFRTTVKNSANLKVIEMTDSNGLNNIIVVDVKTRAMYLIVSGVYSVAITPLLNADGTPRLYEGEL